MSESVREKWKQWSWSDQFKNCWQQQLSKIKNKHSLFVWNCTITSRVGQMEQSWAESCPGCYWNIQYRTWYTWFFRICSAVGLPFGPMYSLVPYLMVGLSIDDMFVLVQTRNNRPVERSQMDLTQRVGLTMMEAGVGITVTSVTEVMVFLIGGSTVLPSLR